MAWISEGWNQLPTRWSWSAPGYLTQLSLHARIAEPFNNKLQLTKIVQDHTDIHFLRGKKKSKVLVSCQSNSTDYIYVFAFVATFTCSRHVILPKDLAELVPRTHLMTESEWRNLGVQQSPGWTHYLIHEPGKIFSNSLIVHQIWTKGIMTITLFYDLTSLFSP